MARKKIFTPEQIESIKGQFQSENLESLLNESYKALLNRVKSGDIKAIRTALEVVQVISPAGINISTNTNILNASTGGNVSRDRGFENIVRKLELKDANLREIEAGEVIDVEVVSDEG